MPPSVTEEIASWHLPFAHGDDERIILNDVIGLLRNRIDIDTAAEDGDGIICRPVRPAA